MNRRRAFIKRSLALLLLLGGTCCLALACAPAGEKSADKSPSTATAPGTSAGASADTASPATQPTREPVLEVATLSFPVDYLVARLGGELVKRRLVAPVGEDPPFWQPSPELIVDLAKSDLIVMSGAGYEAWTAQSSLPLSRLVDASEGLALIETKGRTHSHGGAGEHSHAGTDPHVWSDPDLYRAQARLIHQALVDAAPGEKADFDAGLAKLERQLDALVVDYEKALEPLHGVAMASNHPSFAYLARRFGLEIEVIDLDPATAPSEKALAAFTHWAGQQKAPVLLWEQEPSEEARAAFPDEVHHVLIDPLEQPSAGVYDYFTQARANVERFADLASTLQDEAAAGDN